MDERHLDEYNSVGHVWESGFPQMGYPAHSKSRNQLTPICHEHLVECRLRMDNLDDMSPHDVYGSNATGPCPPLSPISTCIHCDAMSRCNEDGKCSFNRDIIYRSSMYDREVPHQMRKGRLWIL